MRVFLDTNVLVSAFASRGLCADLYESLLGRHELVTGRNVLRELATALQDKIRLTPEGCDERIRSVLDQAVQVVEIPDQVDCDADADDLLVLGEAIAGAADVFVTGDAGLVALRAIGSMRIETPREFSEAPAARKDK